MKDFSQLPPWEEMPDVLAMTAIAKRAHFSLHRHANGDPRVLIWRKVPGKKRGDDLLERRWTVLAELPPKTRAQFEQALAEWNALGVKK